MNRVLPILVLLGIAAMAVWAFLPQPVEVETALVGPATIEVSVEEEGKARIRDVFTVSATIAGKLRRVDLRAGDRVEAGKTVVAVIGPAAPALLDARARAQAEAAVKAAAAAVDLAQSQIAQAEATLDFAVTEADHARQLFDRGAISERILDQAVLDQRTAQAALDSARANLALRSREVDSAQAVLDASQNGGGEPCCVNLVAPVSGRVLRVLTEDEQVVQPGMPILEIGDPANLEIVADLLSRDAVRVAEGAEAWITGWGGPDLKARVARVDPVAETRVSALGIEEQRVEVILTLEGDPAGWRQLGHEFRVLVRIAIWRGDDVLAIPVGALFRDGSDWATFVLRDGQARLQRITLGQRNGSSAEVLQGLSAGDEVILHPGERVEDGASVTTATPG
ncbi:MAG: efflux RND transporter periplasmic adaptor subunit [Paracoccaceae bacterium]